MLVVAVGVSALYATADNERNNKVLNLEKCKKICAKLIRKLKLAGARKHQSKKRSEDDAMTNVLVIDLNSYLSVQVHSLPNTKEQPSVNFKSEQFAFVGDIFYCYI